MSRPRLLDLFSGAGGAAAGYIRAGFDVTGVDIRAQPRYPGAFVQADALEYLAEHGRDFDAIHASPPCQSYSTHVTSTASRWAGTLGQDEPRLIAETRALLEATGRPWIIENVVGARYDLRANILLCGAMFGLPIPRHRLFRASVRIVQPWHAPCVGIAARYADERGWDRRDMSVTGKGRRAGTADRWREVMGIEHPMTQHEMREAIPPAYAEYLGRALAKVVDSRTATG